MYEIGDHGSRRFIAMEYLEGKTLEQVISRRPMELKRMLTVAIDIALPNKGDDDRDHRSRNSSQNDRSGSQSGTPTADMAFKVGIANN
jgi:hypothetical protein